MNVYFASTDLRYNDTQAVTLQKILKSTVAEAGVAAGGSEGAGNPSGAPTDSTKVSIYRNTSNDAVWMWSPNDSAWHQVV